MKRKLLFLPIMLLTLNSCMDIFTSSAFSSLATDVSDMSDAELLAYIESTPLSDISDEDLILIETALAEDRIELTEDDLDNEVLVAQYIAQTTQLLEINMEQADVEGLITEVLSIDEGDEDSDILDTLLEDTERLDNMAEAADYAVDAFLVDPDSLSSTELIVGSIGLISDILQGDKSDDLEAVADFETDTLEAAGFTEDEISDIQTATAMMDLAESNSGEDSPLADFFEGMPI